MAAGRRVEEGREQEGEAPGKKPACLLRAHVDDAAIAGIATEEEELAFPVPGHRGDGAFAGTTQQHFLLVGDARDEDHSVCSLRRCAVP